jgi:cbb3-type cytochrome oxidase subunit 3
VTAAGLQLTGTIATAILALAGIWLSVRPTQKRNQSDAAQSLFNELQEERAELKRERTELKAEVEAIKVELLAAHRREIVRDDFIQDLRNHIRRGLGPPPPDWPEELRHG